MVEKERYSLKISGIDYVIDPSGEDEISKLVRCRIADMRKEAEIKRPTNDYPRGLKKKGHGQLRSRREQRDILGTRSIGGSGVARVLIERNIRVLLGEESGRVEFERSDKGGVVGLKVSRINPGDRQNVK